MQPTDGAPPYYISARAVWQQDGLAVTRIDGWSITHIGSGYTLYSHCISRKDAILMAKRFLELTDWTRSRTALKREKGLLARVKEVRDAELKARDRAAVLAIMENRV